MSKKHDKGILKLIRNITKRKLSKEEIIKNIIELGEDSENIRLAEELIPLLNVFKDEDDIIFALRETLIALDITPFAMNEQGIQKENEDDADGAIHLYELGLLIDPNYQWLWYNMGRMYENMKKDYEKAIECYKNSVAANDSYGDGWNNLGNVYSNIGRYSLAKHAYEKATQSPKYSSNYYPLFNLGLLYDKVENHTKAIEHYLKAIDLKHDYAKAYYNAAKSYKKLGDNDKCMDFFAKAMEIDGSFEKSIRDQGVAVEEIIARQLIKKLSEPKKTNLSIKKELKRITTS